MRPAYLVAIVLPMLLAVVLWALIGTTNPFLRVMFPALLGYHGVLLLGLWSRRLPLRLTGLLLFLGPITVVFSRLLLWRFGILADVGDSASMLGDPADSIGVAAWMGVIVPLAFVAFGTRRGTRVSILVYVAFLALMGPSVIEALFRRSLDVHSIMVLHLTVVFGVLIALLRLLASRLERLAESRARADMLAEQATTDVLTGIANRRRLEDELGRLMAQSRRYEQPLSVILVDLDRFKRVNDEHGHEIGDQVLIETVRRLAAAVRDADLLGRWGGEEFLLLAPNTDHAAACTLAERCQQAISRSPMPIAGEVTASFGVATQGRDEDMRSLMRRADLALYTAKTEGRSRVVGLPGIEAGGVPDTTGSWEGLGADTP